MKNKLKITAYILISITSYYAISRSVNRVMHGFSYENFTLQPPSNYHLTFENIQNVEPLLAQKFTYFNYGGESLVFTSEDNEWVLKVFKKRRMYPFKSLQTIPIFSKLLTRRIRLYNRFWDSLKIQAESLAEFSELHYIHLPKTGSNFNITFIDPIKSEHTFNLDKICFVLQKKGHLFKDVYLQAKDEEEKLFMLTELVSFYRKIGEKGFKIWDNSISRNLGWIDNHPFLIDTGSVSKKPDNESVEHNIKHLKSWINTYDKDKESFVLSLIGAE